MSNRPWQDVYLGLGSNLHQPRRQVEIAIEELKKLAGCEWQASSSLVASYPQGPQDQPDFVNAVVWLKTQLSAQDLLMACQSIERLMGKQKKRDWGERVIDIDLLLYGQSVIDTPDLTVPHPQMLLRDFVLLPLLEISPDVVLPNAQRVADYAPQLADSFIIHSH